MMPFELNTAGHELSGESATPSEKKLLIFDVPPADWNEWTFRQLRCFGIVRAGFITAKDQMWLTLFCNEHFKLEDLKASLHEKLLEIAKKGRDAP